MAKSGVGKSAGSGMTETGRLMQLASRCRVKIPSSFWKLAQRAKESAAARILAQMPAPGIEIIERARACDDKHVKNRVKIGFVTPSYSIPGGAERWIQSVTACCDERVEWSVVAVTNNHHVSGQLIQETACDVAIGREAAKFAAARSDVLIVWGLSRVRDFVPGFLGRVAVVSHGCGDWTRQHLADPTMHETDLRVAVSAAAAKSFPFGSETHVVLNGIDPARILASDPRELVRRRIGLAPHEIAVAYVGRYSFEKNPLAAAQAVAELGPPYRAVYVGDGWKKEDVLKGTLDICPDAIIVPNQEHVGNVLSAIDCYVLASPAEGMSLGLIEAWMAGVPTVSTPVGAVLELEQSHGRITTIVPVNPSRQQLAAAAVAALADAAITARAKAVADQFLTSRAMTKNLIDLIVGRC